MGNEYYGRNDYRDYLAHYGVKGMKWKKRKKRALTPREIKMIRRARLQEQIAQNKDRNARDKAMQKKLNKKASKSNGSKGAGQGVETRKDIEARNRMLAVTSGIRVSNANYGQEYENAPTVSPVKKSSPKNSAKKGKAKLGKLLGKTSSKKEAAKTTKAYRKTINRVFMVMRGTGRK